MSHASEDDLGWHGHAGVGEDHGRRDDVRSQNLDDAAATAEAGNIVAVARAAYEGLTAAVKWLPPWLLYDARGSVLFERITRVPEYYLTRLETELLEAHAREIVHAFTEQAFTDPSDAPSSAVDSAAPFPAAVHDADTARGVASVIELGAGSAKKSRILLAATSAAPGALTYYPVDVSEQALRSAVRHLARELPALSVAPIRARYPEGLGFVAATPAPRLVLFLGSNIGNYEPDDAVALLTEVRRRLDDGDALVLGADLRKDSSALICAYDDSAGVTAAFTKNVLLRLNRELGADFDLGAFRHVAEWNDALSRIELHLESLRAQTVSIPSLDLDVALSRGERIHVESSHKPSPAAVLELLRNAGFHPQRTWTDARRWYGLTLARVGVGSRSRVTKTKT